MPTQVIRYINPLSDAGGTGLEPGTSGADRAFASPQAAISWIGTAYPDLVASDVVVHLRQVGRAPLSTQLTWPTLTTDATRQVVIEPYLNPHLGVYSAAVDGWDYTQNTMMNQPGFRLEFRDMTLNYAGTARNFGTMVSASPVNGCHLTFVRCIRRRNPDILLDPESAHQHTPTIVTVNTAATNVHVVIRSIACLDLGPWAASVRMQYMVSANTRVVQYNCTAVGVIMGVSASLHMQEAKCFFANNRVERRASSAFKAYSWFPVPTGRESTNMADDEDSEVAFPDRTGTFVDPGAGNYTPTGADPGIGAGTDLSADSEYPFAFDLRGNPVTAWMIGALLPSSGQGAKFRPYFTTG